MKNSFTMRKFLWVAILGVTLSTLAIFPLLSRARSVASVNVVNNGNRTIRHVFVSHVDADDWSPDQLGGQSISPGQSANVNNLSCDQQQIKVIAEDQEGCFLTKVIACDTNSTWTITNDTIADCGQ